MVRMAGSGREFHPEEVLGTPPKGMGGVERDRSCRIPPGGPGYSEAFLEGQEESRGLGEVGRLPGGLGGVSRDGRVWEALPESLNGLEGHPG